MEEIPKTKKTAKLNKTLKSAREERYFEAVGRRKTSVARVRIWEQKGDFIINGKNFQQYFSLPHLRQIVFSPLEKSKLDNQMKVNIKVSGGGITGQAEAVRHGLSRALIMFDSNLKSIFKGMGYLRRDPRMVERKKYGLKKARRAPQWQKR